MSFPLIDVSNIGNPQDQTRIADQVTAASRDWGFLLIKGHQIPQAEIDEMFDMGRSFFTLPEDKKEPFPITSQNIGYMGSFKDRHLDDKMSMWFGGAPGALHDNTNSLPPFWRSRVQKLEDFKHKCHELIMQLLECFAISLDLPHRKFFADAHKESEENVNTLRMIMYPARADTFVYSSGTKQRMAAHTDSGSVTLLFQKSGGLEVMSPKGDSWVDAPCYQDCILVNIGDALSFWSGGQLKATPHKISFKTVPADRERQSMAYFAYADPGTVLDPIVARSEAERYYSNGVELTPGMTVGELRRTITKNIYETSTVQKATSVSV